MRSSAHNTVNDKMVSTQHINRNYCASSSTTTLPPHLNKPSHFRLHPIAERPSNSLAIGAQSMSFERNPSLPHTSRNRSTYQQQQ